MTRLSPAAEPAMYHHEPSAPRAIELSVVIPCLNEAETLGTCIEKAQRAIGEHGISGEVVVADNGSRDGSQRIAEQLGARVVQVEERGYGAALMAGILAARGRYVIMGDADDSYDFGEIPKFLEQLRAGSDLVQGCRLPSGGGHVERGAMPFLHRWWGNPMFSRLARSWFDTPIHDVHCGMRGFSREAWIQLDQHCTGMEFASEMVIKSALRGQRISEVPITLHPDGRVQAKRHLRTFRDGWRHLRFYLMFSPRWLYLLPGVSLVLLGLVGYALALPGLRIGGVSFDVHTLLYSSLSIICGFQAVLFAVFAKTFGAVTGLLPGGWRLTWVRQRMTLEVGLTLSLITLLTGVALLARPLAVWVGEDFGPLQPTVTLRWAIPGATLVALGLQGVLSSFFLSILGLRWR